MVWSQINNIKDIVLKAPKLNKDQLKKLQTLLQTYIDLQKDPDTAEMLEGIAKWVHKLENAPKVCPDCEGDGYFNLHHPTEIPTGCMRCGGFGHIGKKSN